MRREFYLLICRQPWGDGHLHGEEPEQKSHPHSDTLLPIRWYLLVLPLSIAKYSNTWIYWDQTTGSFAVNCSPYSTMVTLVREIHLSVTIYKTSKCDLDHSWSLHQDMALLQVTLHWMCGFMYTPDTHHLMCSPISVYVHCWIWTEHMLYPKTHFGVLSSNLCWCLDAVRTRG